MFAQFRLAPGKMSYRTRNFNHFLNIKKMYGMKAVKSPSLAGGTPC